MLLMLPPHRGTMPAGRRGLRWCGSLFFAFFVSSSTDGGQSPDTMKADESNGGVDAIVAKLESVFKQNTAKLRVCVYEFICALHQHHVCVHGWMDGWMRLRSIVCMV